MEGVFSSSRAMDSKGMGRGAVAAPDAVGSHRV